MKNSPLDLDILEREFPPIEITQEIIDANQKNPKTGNVRLAMGKVYTDDNYEKLRKKVAKIYEER